MFGGIAVGDGVSGWSKPKNPVDGQLMLGDFYQTGSKLSITDFSCVQGRIFGSGWREWRSKLHRNLSCVWSGFTGTGATSAATTSSSLAQRKSCTLWPEWVSSTTRGKTDRNSFWDMMMTLSGNIVLWAYLLQLVSHAKSAPPVEKLAPGLFPDDSNFDTHRENRFIEWWASTQKICKRPNLKLNEACLHKFMSEICASANFEEKNKKKKKCTVRHKTKESEKKQPNSNQQHEKRHLKPKLESFFPGAQQ